MRTGLCKLLSQIFLLYLKIVKATGKLVVKNRDLIEDNSMVGYWHGDSFCMQLVLGEMTKDYDNIHVIVTADRRGDIIEGMLKAFLAKAIRLPDGMEMRRYFKDLITFSKDNEGILATALDGPLGPYHEPKKLLFLLAANAKKPVVYIHFEYKRIIRLKHRWDSYVIPLPFSRITAVVEGLGIIRKEELKNFEILKQGMKHS